MQCYVIYFATLILLFARKWKFLLYVCFWNFSSLDINSVSFLSVYLYIIWNYRNNRNKCTEWNRNCIWVHLHKYIACIRKLRWNSIISFQDAGFGKILGINQNDVSQSSGTAGKLEDFVTPSQRKERSSTRQKGVESNLHL